MKRVLNDAKCFTINAISAVAITSDGWIEINKLSIFIANDVVVIVIIMIMASVKYRNGQ